MSYFKINIDEAKKAITGVENETTLDNVQLAIVLNQVAITSLSGIKVEKEQGQKQKIVIPKGGIIK